MTDRRPRSRIPLVVASATTAALTVATASACRSRRLDRVRVERTREALEYLADNYRLERPPTVGCGRVFQGRLMFRDPDSAVGGSTSGAVTVVAVDAGMSESASWLVRDGWGTPVRVAVPGRLHPKGWDVYSLGPNGVDEEGGGDDVVVGRDSEFPP